MHSEYITTYVVSSNPAQARCTRYNEYINTNETDCQDKTEILLKVALNTITLTLSPVPHYVEFDNIFTTFLPTTY